MHRFRLVRHQDEASVVAEGEEFGDGAVAVDWVGGDSERWRSVSELMREHCRDGRIVIRWPTPFTVDEWWGQ